jgi:polyhydroxybutyrate depolymerase
MRVGIAWWLTLGCVIGSACTVAADSGQLIEVADRTVRIHLPAGSDAGAPAPLLILLHGFGSSGDEHEAYLRFAPVARERGLIYAHPDGTLDCNQMRFWNATPACCNFCASRSEVDDVAWLLSVVEAIRARHVVDARRIYLVGHSNGGFMAQRLACGPGDLFAAVVDLAGAGLLDPASCASSQPAHLLHIHGTQDPTILYAGGRSAGGAYPGAVATVEAWAARNGCTCSEAGTPFDLDPGVPGA